MPLFTSSQAAEQVQIGESTLRKYVTEFKSFFSADARKPRGRRYTRQDLALVLKIKRLYSQRMDKKTIVKQLKILDDKDFEDLALLMPDMTAPAQAASSTAQEAKETAQRAEKTSIAVKDEISEWLQNFQGRQEALADRLLAQKKKIEDQEAELKQLRAEMVRFRQQEEERRRKRAAWLKLPRWRRFFTLQPD